MYYFIVNPHAGEGKGLRVWKQVQKLLLRMGEAQRYEVFVTSKRGDAREFSRRITEKCRESRHIIVIGGDGTLNEAVDGSCLDSDQVFFSFIPTGSGNDFARGLKKRLALRKRLRDILEERICTRMDYGVLNAEGIHRRFAVSAGIGFDAAMFRELFLEQGKMKSGLHLRSRRLLYMFTFLRELKRAKKSRGYVLLDGDQRMEFNNIIFIAAQVHPYEGGYKLGPHANCADGYLDLCIVSTKRKSRIIRIMLNAVTGRHQRMTGVHCLRCREAEIHVEEPMQVHTDGESCGELRDLTLRCVPGKLLVLG